VKRSRAQSLLLNRSTLQVFLERDSFGRPVSTPIKAAIDGALADCGKQDRSCRVVAIGGRAKVTAGAGYRLDRVGLRSLDRDPIQLNRITV
jgi:hypothetical protein